MKFSKSHYYLLISIQLSSDETICATVEGFTL